MKKFLIILEKGKDGFGAYSPDLPDCVAVGATQKETEKKMYEAISFHLEGLKEDGITIPNGKSGCYAGMRIDAAENDYLSRNQTLFMNRRLFLFPESALYRP
jgi:predicted RNase H-like HicB family nuclease